MGMVMPEFQREYVWPLEQSKQLLVSLFRGYPTGSLLFWEAKGESIPEIKNNALDREKIGTTKVILDGQQRITTLFLLLKGEIPPYYSENDIKNDPRHLYFNLRTGEFQYYMKSKMSNTPLWQKVIDCFDLKKVDAIDIADECCKNSEEDYKSLLKTLNKNLNTMRSIEQHDYPLQTVPTTAKIDEAIDVFDRANSKGTKLTDAELVLTHIVGKWPQARRKLKEKLNKLKQKNFLLDLDFLTRGMVVALTASALYKKNSKLNYDTFSKEDYTNAWDNLNKTLDYLVPILQQEALVASTQEVNTNNVLIPLIAYLLNNNIKFSENKKYGFLYWMFLALIWGRYSGQTDQRLDKDVYLATNSVTPIEDLVNEIEDQRGRIEVKPSDLEGRGANHPLHKMLYTVTKHAKAVDWSNGSPITGTIGDYYSIQSHHIFPQALLYKNGYDSENHLDKKKVNEIANRAFITRDTNFELSDKPPAKYLPEISSKYPGNLEKQYIPTNEELWEIEKYEAFLEKRRELIAKGINTLLGDLKNRTEPSKEPEPEEDWLGIINKGENDYVEFKSSSRWDYNLNQVNKKLEYVIVKTLAAFINTEGGRLFIGVDDDKTLLGIENDYATLGKKQDQDGFLLNLTNVINTYLGKEFHQNITVKIKTINNKDICCIEITPRNGPAFLKNKDGSEEFFIRASASTQPMGVRETNEYINSRWPDK